MNYEVKSVKVTEQTCEVWMKNVELGYTFSFVSNNNPNSLTDNTILALCRKIEELQNEVLELKELPDN